MRAGLGVELEKLVRLGCVEVVVVVLVMACGNGAFLRYEGWVDGWVLVERERVERRGWKVERQRRAYRRHGQHKRNKLTLHGRRRRAGAQGGREASPWRRRRARAGWSGWLGWWLGRARRRRGRVRSLLRGRCDVVVVVRWVVGGGVEVFGWLLGWYLLGR